MTNVVIIEKQRSNIRYSEIFSFDFDQVALCSQREKKEKILVKDIDLDVLSTVEDYDYVILVGAEPFKHVAKMGNITSYQGSLVDDKFLPITNPAIIKFRPSAEKDFNQAVKKVESYIAGEELKTAKLNLKGIRDPDEAIAWLDEMIAADPKVIAWDSETTCLYPRDGHVLGICLAYKEDSGVYIDSDCITDDVYARILYAAQNFKSVFHNRKFDRHMLAYHFDLEFKDSEDTMLLHYTLDENDGHGLKDLSLKYTDLGDYDHELDTWKREYCRKNKVLLRDFTYDLIPFDIMVPYAATDPIATLKLYNKLKPAVMDNRKLLNVYENILLKGSEFLQQVEDNGVPFDKETLAQVSVELEEQIFEAKLALAEMPEIAKLETITGVTFNPGSVPQLRQLLFNLLGLKPVEFTAKGEPSTNAATLEILGKQHPVAANILKVRRLTKIKSTYIDKIILGLDRDSRLRTNFNLHVTTSGRLSSSGKLNMQQLPRDDKRVKKCIKARDGYKIVSMD